MERLQVFLELITGQYKREAKEAATATQAIGTSAKTAGTETTKSLQGANQQVAAFKGLVAGAAVGAVVAFGKATINAASNLEESMNAVNVTFGEAADGIHGLGEDAVDSFGLSQRAFNEFAVRFSAFAENIAGSSGRSVVEVVEEMTTRIADFASVHNLTMEEAATIAQSTLAGETEAFRRFGGDVSAAAVELKAMELGLGDTSAELTEQEKILARYELFMEQTDKTAGDFANTQDSLANQQRTLTANFEEFQAMLGNLVIPLVADSIGQFNQMLDVLKLIGDVLPGVDGGTVSFGSALGGALEMLNPLTPALQAAENWLAIFKKRQDDAAQATETANAFYDRGHDVLEAYNEAAQPLPPLIDEMTFAQGRGEAALDAYNEQGRIGAARQAALARETELSTDQLRAQFDLIDGRLSAVDNLNTAVERQAEAQAEVARLVAEQKEGTPEHIDALEDLFGANRDVADAQLRIAEEGQLTRAEWIKQQTELGATYSEASLLADQLERIGAFRPPPINFQVTVNGRTYGSIAAVERAIQGAAGKQHGGPVTAGSAYVVGEAGPELFIPIQSGQIISHTESVKLIGGGGGGVNIGSVYATGTPAHIAHEIGQQVALELRMA